jgi:transposase
MLMLAELHDFRRFHSPRAVMAYVGLVPGEDSSGEKQRRGRITRTGNALVRRLLVETAWHYQHRPGVGPALTRRPKGTTGPRDCHCRQGAAAIVSSLPALGGTT